MARLLGRVESRFILSIAIIVSLLPFDWVPRLDGLFLILFAIEFVLRALLVFRGEATHSHGSTSGVTPTEAEIEENRGWQWPSTATLVLMVFDLLALLSFVPGLIGLETTDAQTRWLRLFRLTRMMLLVSYWAPLVRDVWSVLLRQERAKQVALMGVVVAALSFAGAVVIDQLHPEGAEYIDYDGDQEFGVDPDTGAHIDEDDAKFYIHLWWAFRQIQDPGNMLSAPQQAAAVVVSVALTVVGLFMVSFLIGLGTDVVRELMEIARLRPPGLTGHTIIVNIDPSTQQLLHELLRYSRKLLPEGALSLGWLAELLRNTKRGIRSARYLVVGRSAEPPDFLRQPDLARIVYRQVHVEDETFIVRTDIADAQRVVLLADLEAEDPDAETIQALLTITASLREADEEAKRRDSLFGLTPTRRRARLLIAEVLDESNVPAARAAITGDVAGRDSEQTRAFVVPSERLIALFIACITRRPGVGRLLEELLTSHGHELYTMFFKLDGLGYQRERRPDLPDDPSEVMGELIRRSRSIGTSPRVVPVGVLMAGEGGLDIDVHINPPPDFSGLGAASLDAGEAVPPEALVTSSPTVTESELVDTGVEDAHEEVSLVEPMPAQLVAAGAYDTSGELEVAASGVYTTLADGESRCLGFIAIADNFGRVLDLTNDLYERPRRDVPDDLTGTGSATLGPFVPAPTTRLRRVLVCGFRSGTVSMVESLIQAEFDAEILIMVQDEEAWDAAWDDFDAHSKLVARGLLRGHHGPFIAKETFVEAAKNASDQPKHKLRSLTWVTPRRLVAPHHGAHVRLVIGDWSSSRQLTELPLGFGHVETMDAVILISSEHHGSDARTAKTLMKLETLTQAPRVVAEVLDVELARRLRRRGLELGSERVRVYSIQELRAFFMFQSVVVPAFDLVYTELMGPWGQSFVQMAPDPREGPLTGRCSFEELANHLSQQDRVLVGVELCVEDGSHRHSAECRTTLHVADAGDDAGVDLARLVDVWVISGV